MRISVLALLLLGLATTPGAAVTREELGACNVDVAPRNRIAPCTAILARAGISRDLRTVAFNYRGRAFEALGQYARAAQDFTQAIRLDPTDPDLYVWRGLVYVKLGRLAEANADGVKALELLDKDPDPDQGIMEGLAILIQELKKRGVPGGPASRAGARPDPPRAAPPPAGTRVDFTWRIHNRTGETVQFKLFAPARSQVWPGVGRNWRLEPGARLDQPIRCLQGEKICYGAWYRSDPDTYWGVGLDGDEACDGCCTTCSAAGISPDYSLDR